MAFESLSERLSQTFKNISGRGKLSEKNMNDMLREVRMSLLEADVNYQIVKDFIERIKEKANGTKVMESLNPSQMVVKIVRDEICELLGNEDVGINYQSSGITGIMMVGLQGSGKTTASAKIANLMQKKQSRQVLLVACDVVRPAAIEQLKTLGSSINVEVFSLGDKVSALETAKKAYEHAKNNKYDTVLFDTAGRLHIDEELMQELQDIKSSVDIHEILLTVDAMSGQDIVSVAKSFHETLDVQGLVVTKLDGDARGGGVLSVRSLTKIPVKFVGLGEKIDDLDIFYPQRMADRILGMGDILSLVEQAQDKMDVEATTKASNKMLSGKFTMNEMLVQFQQLMKMGSLGNIMKMVPGMSQMSGQIDEAKADNKIKKSEAIILSMTLEERLDPNLLKASRKNRIAKGSGTQVSDVNRLISEFEKMKTMMKQMGQMNGMGGKGMGGMGGMKNMRAMKQMMKKGRR